jgi:hypothetical protein
MQGKYLWLVCFVWVVSGCSHPENHIVGGAQPKPPVLGCMDTNATNYYPLATISDVTQCRYVTDSVTGVYDVIDTALDYTSMGPRTTITNVAVEVTRVGKKGLHFSAAVGGSDAPNGVSYNASTHHFGYSYYPDAYTNISGSGYFDGNVLYYSASIFNSMASLTPSNHGRGIKR